MIRLEETTVIDAPIERCFDLSRSVEVHLVANVHYGEQALAVCEITSGLVGLSPAGHLACQTLRRLAEPDQQDHGSGAPVLFSGHDDSRHLPFMQADHLFRSLPSGATEMKDLFPVAAPLPFLGPLAEALFLRRYMLALLRERNAVIKNIAESFEWQQYLPSPAERREEPAR